MKYIKLFTNNAEYEEYVATKHPLPNVSLAVEENDVHYEPKHDYGKDYLTFVAKADGTFKFSATTSSAQINYSLDEGETWTSLASNTNTPTVTSGSKIMWKAALTPGGVFPSYGIGKFSSSAKFDVEGNPMSLLFGDDFKDKTSLSGKNYVFFSLFASANVVSAENMSLPATTLAQGCYYQMFSGCWNLTTAPTSIGDSSATIPISACTNMFSYCRSLTTAPQLPATTLARSCYENMFNECTHLETAPELPATTLAELCYNNMFSKCTSLTTAPELPATTLADNCYSSMFSGCTSLITAPALNATTLANGCYTSMFSGCTSLTTAPELPATTLTFGCYISMFGGCKSLTTAPELPATTLANYCYNSMFSGCTSLTEAPQLLATTLAESCYYKMFNGCSQLNYIKCLATDISASSCTANWVQGVASSGTFVKAASMTSWTTSNNGIPTNWTVQDAS